MCATYVKLKSFTRLLSEIQGIEIEEFEKFFFDNRK